MTMDFEIRECTSLDSFLKFWTESMIGYEFVQNPTPYDYLLEEEQVELVQAFQGDDTIFLEAMSKKDNKVIGNLNITIRENTAKLGIWQPSVLLEYRDKEIGISLLRHALGLLRERGISRMLATLKYANILEVQWHKSLYKEFGLEARTSEGVQLFSILKENIALPSVDFSGKIVSGNEVSLEQFSDMTIHAFASTEQDQSIHDGWNMDDLENVRAIHKRIQD